MNYTRRYSQRVGFACEPGGIGRESQEELIQAAGFEVLHLYGDYAYAAFATDTSLFMIYSLRRFG